MNNTLLVAISTVQNGNMYNRHDPLDPDVIENRRRYLSERGIDFNRTTRVNVSGGVRITEHHETNWCRYVDVDNTLIGKGMTDGHIVFADALVTNKPNVALFLPVADCVGTVLYDPVKQVVMVSHLGRHSLEQNGGVMSVQYLIDHYQSRPEDIKVWLTPAPNKEAFPIWALDGKGMKEATFEQLAAAGIRAENITDNPADTVTDLNYYSYSEFLKGNRPVDGDYAIVARL